MLRNFYERLIMGLLALVLLIWGGYHAYQYYRSPLEYETVFEYSVTRTILGQGIAVREERVIEEDAPGVGSYQFDNATRISVGETVAEFYETDAGDRNARRMRELDREIEMLRYAQNANINNFANADVINREIRDSLGNLNWIVSTGRCDGLAVVREELTSLVNRRQVATGKTENFNERIALLTDEYTKLDSQTASDSIYQVKAPLAGYFSRNVDGFESAITPGMLDDMSVDEYLTLMESTAPRYGMPMVGKMVTNQVWHFAVAVSPHQTEWLFIGQVVNMELEGLPQTIPATVMDLKMENTKEKTIVLLRCDYMSDMLIDLRVADVKLHSSRYTGLRVNSEALRFQDSVRGVYVIEDNTIRFRRLKPVYEEQTFIISDMAANALEGDGHEMVKLYDQIITKGIVYDGMPVQ